MLAGMVIRCQSRMTRACFRGLACAGVYRYRSAQAAAEQDSAGATSDPAPTELTEATNAPGHKPSASWPQSLGLRSEHSNVPPATVLDLSSTASSRAVAARDSRAAAPAPAAAPPAAEAVHALAEVPSGDAVDGEVEVAELAILPVSQVASVLTEVTTMGSVHKGAEGAPVADEQARGRAKVTGWRRMFTCMCSAPDSSPGRRRELIAMQDAMPEGGSPEKEDKCMPVCLPPLDPEQDLGAAGVEDGGACADSIDADTFQELDVGDAAAAADDVESSEDEGSDDGDDAAHGPVNEDALRDELAGVAVAAQAVFRGAAACAARDSARSHAESSGGDAAAAPASSESIDLTAVLGDSPASPRLLASFGYKHRQSRSRAHLGGPASGDVLQRTARGVHGSLVGSLGIGGLDSVASSVLNGHSKRWALRSVGGNGVDLGRAAAESLGAECRKVFLQARQSRAALEAVEDLSWMAFASASTSTLLRTFLSPSQCANVCRC